MTNSPARFRRRNIVLIGALAVILTGQIAAFHSIKLVEQSIGSPLFEQLPARVGSWTVVDEQPLEGAILKALKPDDYILRTYARENRTASINLFVAYFKSLQNSYGPHSPRVCLPGAGWLTHSWKVSTIAVPGKPQNIPVNEYVLEKGGERILVLYWYQNSRRVWAREFEAKFYLLPDLMRHRQSDASLVRLIASIGKDLSITNPLRNSQEFAREMFPFISERLAAETLHF